MDNDFEKEKPEDSALNPENGDMKEPQEKPNESPVTDDEEKTETASEDTENTESSTDETAEKSSEVNTEESAEAGSEEAEKETAETVETAAAETPAEPADPEHPYGLVMKGPLRKMRQKAFDRQAERAQMYAETEERMKTVHEERREQMYADGKEPNAIQKFLMSEGKYINYENKNIIVLLSAVVIFAVAMIFIVRGGFITKEKFGLGNPESRAIVYTMDNEVYCYDLKNEPVKISDNLSSGGQVTYSYVGGGVKVAEDGKSVYFIDNAGADGLFNLKFYKAGSKNEPSLISENVADYAVSYNGDGAVYIVPDESGKTGTLYGYERKSDSSALISENVYIDGSEYSVSADGKHIVYAVQEGQTINLNVSTIDGAKQETVSSDVAQYIVTKTGNTMFYLKAVGADDGTSTYDLYGYDLKKGVSTLIDTDIISVLLSENENTVIYYKNNGKMIKVSDVVTDDLDDSENSNAIRQEIEEFEFRDIACAVYRYNDGKSALVNDSVYQAVPMDKDGKYIAYTVPQKLDKIKVNLSSVSSVKEIAAMYYVQAMQASVDTYIYETDGFDDYVVFKNPSLYSFQNSATNAQCACFVNYDENAKQGQLILSSYYPGGIKAYSELEKDVSSFEFLGDGNRIVYMSGVDTTGEGTLRYIESNVADVISENAYYYEAATDLKRRVFYLEDFDEETLGGELHYYQQGDDVTVDEDVYMVAYRNNDNALYMKNFDIMSGTGDLYYLNGKNSVLVAEGVQSVFDFYADR